VTLEIPPADAYIGDVPPELKTPTDLSTPGFWLHDWCVYPELDRISRDGATVHLEPKVMDLLVYLARHSGQVVSKNDIIDTVWEGHIVANSALSRCMALLRGALGDDARRPRYIETIPKRGYRLIVPITGIEPDVTDTQATTFRIRVGEREIPLSDGEHLVGRSPEATVCIDSPKVSRHHARIQVDGDQARIEDMGSKNGTYVGGTLVTALTPLRDGDEIVAGSMAITFIDVREGNATETMSDPDRPPDARPDWGL
jgi:DNA-binding winged helix-turn-helix (wHTH) protein